MRTIIVAMTLLSASLLACAAEPVAEEGAEDTTVAPEGAEDTTVAPLDENGLKPSAELAGCGRVTLEYCNDPRTGGSWVDATCVTQYRCKCADARPVCASLVRQHCGRVDVIVTKNCSQ